MPDDKQHRPGLAVDDEPVAFVETPGPFHPIDELRAFLAELPAMGLSRRQEAEAREEVERALAFRLANPLPEDQAAAGSRAAE